MSCGNGCGCCPKCGCRATCTCNQSMWFDASPMGDLSYNVMVMACKTDECGAKRGCSVGTCANDSFSCGWFSEAAAYVAYYG
ncbi:hypothetical protein M758_6G030100 [Ceratodon purpureus]|jgi:hypothetical protein|uniref:Uncharacterized protein n=1 Tax=Ceratodon purpureus TaxID=3225 RepID=A0A8T0HBG1_CERPU|nr:hypothetical protein KC19_6G033000 [Ceratodon purpureus]KAG0612467.1 hypothetical protein M758_6G030100 [Ceratodon purpureus]